MLLGHNVPLCEDRSAATRAKCRRVWLIDHRLIRRALCYLTSMPWRCVKLYSTIELHVKLHRPSYDRYSPTKPWRSTERSPSTWGERFANASTYFELKINAFMTTIQTRLFPSEQCAIPTRVTESVSVHGRLQLSHPDSRVGIQHTYCMATLSEWWFWPASEGWKWISWET